MHKRADLHAAALEAKARFALTGGNDEARIHYLGLARKLYGILFGDVIDNPTRKLSRQIFLDYRSDFSLRCAHAIVSIAGCEELSPDQTRQLIRHVRSRRSEAAVAFLESIGLSTATANYYVQPLRAILR